MSNIYTQLAFDNFNRANESPLNPANWSLDASRPSDPLQVLNNLCVAGNLVDLIGQEYWSGVVFPEDQYVEATLGPVSLLSNEVAVYARANPDFSSCYILDWMANGDGTATLSLFNNDFSPIGSAVVNAATGDVFRLEVVGSVLTVFYNGVQKIQVVDDTVMSGQPGLFIGFNTVVTDTSVSLFTAGSIAGSSVYSVPDDRNYGTFPNNFVDVQGTMTYTVPSVDSRTGGSPVDSRTAGAPSDSRISPNIPENSRQFPPF